MGIFTLIIFAEALLDPLMFCLPQVAWVQRVPDWERKKKKKKRVSEKKKRHKSLPPMLSFAGQGKKGYETQLGVNS